MMVKNCKLRITFLLAMLILILNGVVIYKSFFQEPASASSVANPKDDPAEMSERAGPGSYVEINSTTDYEHAASR